MIFSSSFSAEEEETEPVLEETTASSAAGVSVTDTADDAGAEVFPQPPRRSAEPVRMTVIVVSGILVMLCWNFFFMNISPDIDVILNAVLLVS